MNRLLPPLLTFVLTASMQQSGPLQRGDVPITTLRTSTKLVVVDVHVTGKNNQVVHGLKAGDFQLLENGKAQTVKSFEEHTAPTAAEVAKIPPMPKLPAGTFTNFTPAPSTVTNGPVNILLIDRLNTPLIDQTNLRNQVVIYLKKAKPGQRIAIFSLNMQLIMLQGFTDDPAILREAVENSKGKVSSLLRDAVGGGGPTLDDMANPKIVGTPTSARSAPTAAQLREFMEDQIDAAQKKDRALRTLDGLNSLARYLAGIPGRKNLVWFSGSFPLTILPDPNAPSTFGFAVTDDFEAEFRETVSLLSRAQVAVYPVDARGASAQKKLNAAYGGAMYRPQELDVELSDHFDENTTMREMAYATGGRSFTDDNDLAGAMEEAIHEGSDYYTLAYTPSNGDWRGDFRKIEVKLREQGYELNYRRGYYADDPEAPPSAWEKQGSGRAVTSSLPVAQGSNAMRAALLHGGPAPTEIVFSVQAAPVSAATEDAVAPGNEAGVGIKGPYRRYSLTFVASPRGLQWKEEADGSHHGTVQFITFVYTQDGERMDSIDNTVHMDLSKAQYTEALQHNMVFHQQVSVPVKGEYFMRVAVHDLEDNHVGAVEIPVSSVRELAVAASAK